MLFAEVAALAQIYRRPIDYFLYTGAHLDSVLDAASKELVRATEDLQRITQTMAEVKELKADMECTAAVTGAMLKYRNTGDGGTLLGDLRMLVARWRHRCLTRYGAYEAIDVTPDQLREVDMAGLRNSALWEWEHYQRQSMTELQQESPEMLNGVSDFLEGHDVSPALVEVLREGAAWSEVVTMQLTELVMGAVDTQIFSE